MCATVVGHIQQQFAKLDNIESVKVSNGFSLGRNLTALPLPSLLYKTLKYLHILIATVAMVRWFREFLIFWLCRVRLEWIA